MTGSAELRRSSYLDLRYWRQAECPPYFLSCDKDSQGSHEIDRSHSVTIIVEGVDLEGSLADECSSLLPHDIRIFVLYSTRRNAMVW